MAADNSDLGCIGVTYIHLGNHPTKALVATAISQDILVGWPDLRHLGVIPQDFPTFKAATTMSDQYAKVVTDLQEEFPQVFSSTLPETPLKGTEMKIRLSDDANLIKL